MSCASENISIKTKYELGVFGLDLTKGDIKFEITGIDRWQLQYLEISISPGNYFDTLMYSKDIRYKGLNPGLYKYQLRLFTKTDSLAKIQNSTMTNYNFGEIVIEAGKTAIVKYHID